MALYPASIDGQKATGVVHAAGVPVQRASDYVESPALRQRRRLHLGPDVNVTYSTYTDAFGKAIQNKSSFLGALTTMQTTTVADMKKSGFKTTG